MKYIGKQVTNEFVIIELLLMHTYEDLHALVQERDSYFIPDQIVSSDKMYIRISRTISKKPFKAILKIYDHQETLQFFMNIIVSPRNSADSINKNDFKPKTNESSRIKGIEENQIMETIYFDHKSIADHARKIVFKQFGGDK